MADRGDNEGAPSSQLKQLPTDLDSLGPMNGSLIYPTMLPLDHPELPHVQYADHNTEVKNSVSDDPSSPVEIDGVHYNSRGYEICGQLNQHSKPCQRIGTCPFHKKNSASGDKPSPDSQTPETNTPDRTGPAGARGKKPGNNKPAPLKKAPFKRGWTKEEHLLFLNGLQIHGKGAWKEISMIVQTRTPTQIQSHAQKYFLRQKQEIKNKRSIHDISLDDINDLTPEPPRLPHPSKSLLSQLSRPSPAFGYPMITSFPQEHLNMILNPMNGSNSVPPSYPIPYSSPWIPQMYPFALPMSLPQNIQEDRNLGLELDHEQHQDDPLLHLPKSPNEYSPSLGDKRPYDSFATLHGYQEDRSPKTMKNSDDYLFH